MNPRRTAEMQRVPESIIEGFADGSIKRATASSPELLGRVRLGERLNAGVAEAGTTESAEIEDTISALIKPRVNLEKFG